MSRFSHIDTKKFWDNKVFAMPDVDTIQHHVPLYGGWVLVQEHMQAKLELYHKPGGKWVTVLALWLKEDDDSRMFGYFIAKHGYAYTAVQMAMEKAGFSFSAVSPHPIECLKEMAFESYQIIPFGRV